MINRLTCIPRSDCGLPPVFANAGLVYQTDSYSGAMATYDCLYSSESFTINCTAYGNWSAAYTCPEVCGYPPYVIDSTVEFSGLTAGDHANYTCFSDGSTFTIDCDDDGNWDAPDTCPLECGQPPVIDMATVEVHPGTYAGSTATYTCCSDGSTFNITCGLSGSWTDPTESCPTDCGPVPQVPGATYVSTGTVQGSSTTYNCSYSWYSFSIVCHSNGSWSDTDSCPAGCGSTPLVPNACLVGQTGFHAGSSATYDCLYSNESFAISCDVYGDWSTPYTCPEDCGPPPNVNGAWYVSDGTVQGSVTTYNCTYSWFSFYIVCLSNGSWSDTETCPAVCGVPDDVSGADKFYNGTTEWSYTNYTCVLDGFVFQIVCGEDGNWSPPNHTCPLGCTDPPIIPNTIIVDTNGTAEGSYAEYECIESATAVVNERPIIFCINGQWEEPLITCAPFDEPCLEEGDNWFRFQDYCYTFDQNQKLIDDSHTYCAGLGASLVYIEDALEMEWVLKFAKYMPQYCCWWMDLRYINGFWMIKDESTGTYSVATFTLDLPNITDPPLANGTCARFNTNYQPPENPYHWEIRVCENQDDKEKAICKKYSPLP